MASMQDLYGDSTCSCLRHIIAEQLQNCTSFVSCYTGKKSYFMVNISVLMCRICRRGFFQRLFAEQHGVLFKFDSPKKSCDFSTNKRGNIGCDFFPVSRSRQRKCSITLHIFPGNDFWMAFYQDQITCCSDTVSWFIQHFLWPSCLVASLRCQFIVSICYMSKPKSLLV